MRAKDWDRTWTLGYFTYIIILRSWHLLVRRLPIIFCSSHKRSIHMPVPNLPCSKNTGLRTRPHQPDAPEALIHLSHLWKHLRVVFPVLLVRWAAQMPRFWCSRGNGEFTQVVQGSIPGAEVAVGQREAVPSGGQRGSSSNGEFSPGQVLQVT